MFTANSSSSDEDGETPRTPFNAISAAAVAQRRRLSRQTRISRARAAPEDSEAFAYDEALESVERKRRAAPRPERKSRYIGKLVKQVEKRKEEQQRVEERRLVKEREQEDHLYEDKERFVTKAYKRQLSERNEKEKADKEEEEQSKSRRWDASSFIHGLRDQNWANLESGNTPRQSSEAPGADVVDLNGDYDVDKNASGKELVEKKPEESEKFHSTHPAIPETGKKRRRSRFALAAKDAETVSVVEKSAVKEKPKRGLRRNDEKAIEAYRQRYFQRRAKRLAEKSKEAGTVGR